MYKVLIIDDELPSREAIRILGDWDGLKVGDVFEADNGRTGLALVKEKKPDIVLVDMKMPEMNGPEFLQAAETEYPDLITIVISGYNDFEYTRQAIKSKAFDYILKPVNRHDLNQALAKAVDSLEEKRKRESEFIDRNIALNMSLPKLKEKIYISLIERSFRAPASSDYLKVIGADVASNRFNSAILRMLNLEAVKASRFQNDTDLLHFAVTNVINELGSGSFQCFSFANPKQEREIIVVLTYASGYPEEISYSSTFFIRKAIFKISELFGIAAVAGVGAPCESAAGLGDSYEAADTLLNAVNLLEIKESTVAGGKPRASASPHSIAGRMGLIHNALEDGDSNVARSVVSDYIKHIKNTGYFSLGEAYRTLNEFIILLNDAAMELGVSQDGLSINGLKAAGVSFDFTRFEEFEALLLQILDYYSGLLRSYLKSGSQFSIHEIKEYVDRYYFEDIKISMFTEKYFLSREYLMKLFKQEFGSGIHEYVQKVRMEKAAELLKDPNLKIQSISEMLGYKDKNYFSKAFRNYYSLSPTEYRVKHQ